MRCPLCCWCQLETPLLHFDQQALEVGPHRNTAGPGLLALRNVRMAPEAVAAWIAAEPSLSRHVQVRAVALQRLATQASAAA